MCRDSLNGENFDRSNDKYYHFLLIAKDSKGHQQIRELSTRAWMRSYVTQGKMRRVPTYYQDLIDIIGTEPGHVIGSTACLGGFLDTKLLQWVRAGRPDQLYQQIIGWIRNIENIFGKGNFYLEMQPSANDEQECANKELFNLSEITGIPYIITIGRRASEDICEFKCRYDMEKQEISFDEAINIVTSNVKNIK